MNDMEPGADIYKPIKYSLSVYKEPEREMSVMYLAASTPFPNFQSGDILKTIAWSLSLEGRLVIVEEVHTSFFSIEDQVYCQTHLYCRFPSETPS